jgi:hypothetical protein
MQPSPGLNPDRSRHHGSTRTSTKRKRNCNKQNDATAQTAPTPTSNNRPSTSDTNGNKPSNSPKNNTGCPDYRTPLHLMSGTTSEPQPCITNHSLHWTERRPFKTNVIFYKMPYSHHKQLTQHRSHQTSLNATDRYQMSSTQSKTRKFARSYVT